MTKLQITRDEFVQNFAEAIATMEGFYKPGSVSQRQNNPGNLRSWGNTQIVNGYANFPNVGKGWEALRKQVSKNLYERKLTIAEFFAGKPNVYGGYSPAADANHPKEYAEFVCDFINKRIASSLTPDSIPAEFAYMPEVS